MKKEIKNAVGRKQLNIDLPPELRRRIKADAALNDVTMKNYVISVLEKTVPNSRPTAPVPEVISLAEQAKLKVLKYGQKKSV